MSNKASGEVREINEYWSQRFLEQRKRNLRKAEEYYKEMEKVYSQAISGYEKEITTWYNRIADNENINIEEAYKLLEDNELEEFKWDLEDYIKRGREYGVDNSWSRQLENASAKYHINRYEALQIRMRQHLEELSSKKKRFFRKSLKEVYEDTFYHTAFEINKGLGIGNSVGVLDKNLIEAILDSPWDKDGRNFSDKIWGDKVKLLDALDTELRAGLIRGDDLSVITNNLSMKMDVSLGRARTLVNTESAAFYAMAQNAAYNDLGVEQYQIDSVLDKKTSKKCREMDRRVFLMVLYEIWKTAPPFHHNCRTDTIPYFDDEFSEYETRAARDEYGNIIHIPSDITYNEWYNLYVANPTGKGKWQFDELGRVFVDLAFDARKGETYRTYPYSKHRRNMVMQYTNKSGGISRDYYDENGFVAIQVHNNPHNNLKEHNYKYDDLIDGAHFHIWKYDDEGNMIDRKHQRLLNDIIKQNIDILRK